jgi:hypothetical protein
MRQLRRTLLTAAALALCAAPIALAAAPRDQAGHGGGHVRPAKRVDGTTGSRLLAQWFSQLLALPMAQNPLAGNGQPCLRLGPGGRVLSPVNGGPRTTVRCNVEARRPVFLVTTDVECSTAEEAPFHAVGAANQRRCAIKQLRGIVPQVPSIKVTVDHGPTVQIRRRAFVIRSRQGRTVFPDTAIFEPSTGGPATFAGAAWAAQVRGFRPGPHTIRVDYTFSSGPFTATFLLNVVPRA